MASLDMSTESEEIEAMGFMLDFSKTHISPTYAVCLANLLEKQEGCYVDFQVPNRRSKPSIGEAEGTDINAFSRRGSFAAVNYSSRGTRMKEWNLDNMNPSFSDAGPREGTLGRRHVPSPKERMHFPNLIRKDKQEQQWLEMKIHRATAIQFLQVTQEECKIASAKKEANGERFRSVIKERRQGEEEEGENDDGRGSHGTIRAGKDRARTRFYDSRRLEGCGSNSDSR